MLRFVTVGLARCKSGLNYCGDELEDRGTFEAKHLPFDRL